MKREKPIESPALFDPTMETDMTKRIIGAGRQVEQKNTQAHAAAAGLQVVCEVRPFRPFIKKNNQTQQSETKSTT